MNGLQSNKLLQSYLSGVLKPSSLFIFNSTSNIFNSSSRFSFKAVTEITVELFVTGLEFRQLSLFLQKSVI